MSSAANRVASVNATGSAAPASSNRSTAKAAATASASGSGAAPMSVNETNRDTALRSYRAARRTLAKPIIIAARDARCLETAY